MTANDDWFTGANYRRGQPYPTLASDHWLSQTVAKRIEELVENPRTARALEVGPGTTPLLERTAIPNKFYLDSSVAVVRQLRKQVPGAAVLLHDIRDIPVSRNPHFDVVVASEIFTNVLPGQRIDALDRLAARAKALLVIDRPAMTDQEIERELRKSAMMRALEGHPQEGLRLLSGYRIPQDAIERGRLQRVDFNPLKQHLLKLGFSVEVDPYSTAASLSTRCLPGARPGGPLRMAGLRERK